MTRVSSFVIPSSDEDTATLPIICDGLLGLKGMEDAVEKLKVLLHREQEAYPPCKDYLQVDVSVPFSGSEAPAEVVNEAWRRKLTEWAYECVDHFGFDREVVAIAMNFLDRAVAAKAQASSDPIGKRDFQLFAVTCLYMAIKIHGETEDTTGPRRKLRIDAFVELSRGFFSVELIEATERTVLETLNWRVNPPTTLQFIHFYLRLIPKWTNDVQTHSRFLGGIYDIARYLAELSVCVSSLTFSANTSLVAYAAILCANEALESSLAIPYETRIILQNNIAQVTGLLPNDPQVIAIRQLIRELCPDMFQHQEMSTQIMLGLPSTTHVLSESENIPQSGKVSPVSVVESPNGSSRKRTRAVCSEQWSSSQRSLCRTSL